MKDAAINREVIEESIPSSPVLSGGLTPVFRISLRGRHSENAPVEIVHLKARTIASARHAARLAHPDKVILSVERS